VKELRAKCYEAMNDDLNTPIVIAQLFEGARIINNRRTFFFFQSHDVEAEQMECFFQLFQVFGGYGGIAGNTVDFSNEALQASEKGLQRLMEAIDALDKITPAPATLPAMILLIMRAPSKSCAMTIGVFKSSFIAS